MRHYRGKTKDGKWVYGWYSYNPLQKRGQITYWDEIRCYVFEVIPESVGQSTGFFDKNNDEIYAGHKIDVHPDGKREFIRTVVWDDKFAQFRALFPDGSGQLFTKRQCLTYEICGDIHTTPLEKDNE